MDWGRGRLIEHQQAAKRRHPAPQKHAAQRGRREGESVKRRGASEDEEHSVGVGVEGGGGGGVIDAKNGVWQMGKNRRVGNGANGCETDPLARLARCPSFWERTIRWRRRELSSASNSGCAALRASEVRLAGCAGGDGCAGSLPVWPRLALRLAGGWSSASIVRGSLPITLQMLSMSTSNSTSRRPTSMAGVFSGFSPSSVYVPRNSHTCMSCVCGTSPFDFYLCSHKGFLLPSSTTY